MNGDGERAKFDVRTFGDSIIVMLNPEAVHQLLDLLKEHRELDPPMFTLRKRLRGQLAYLEAMDRVAREDAQDNRRPYRTETDFDDELEDDEEQPYGGGRRPRKAVGE